MNQALKGRPLTEETYQAYPDDTNTAHVSSKYCGKLAYSALKSSTLPMDYMLWHRRFAHHNHADIKMMLDRKWVEGVKLDSKLPPDPICEPERCMPTPFPPQIIGPSIWYTQMFTDLALCSLTKANTGHSSRMTTIDSDVWSPC
jgi:hypothetical protein